MDKVRMVHHDCDPILSEDKKLPYTAWLVQYILDAEVHHDIVVSERQVDVFDYYWDRYRDDLVSFVRSEGRVNPRLWSQPSKETKKKK